MSRLYAFHIKMNRTVEETRPQRNHADEGLPVVKGSVQLALEIDRRILLFEGVPLTMDFEVHAEDFCVS